MSWPRMMRPRRASSVHDRPWSPEEVGVLASAVSRAPSVHNIQPWSLNLEGRTATLRLRQDAEVIRHDPHGRDRRISCGAALANLVLAVRCTGWAADVRLEQWEGHSDIIATVAGSHREEPTARQSQRFRAITRRQSHRYPFDPQPLSDAMKDSLLAATGSSIVHARWVTGEAPELARLFTYAARVYQDDSEYQRELEVWTIGETADQEDTGQGIPERALGRTGLPAVGLSTSGTRVPDEYQLASRIESESVMVLSTPSDSRRAHVQAGEAMELAWLEATSLGASGSVMTQSLHLSEVRSGVADSLGLPGVPQMLMRFGYPATIPVMRSSRRSEQELFDERE